MKIKLITVLCICVLPFSLHAKIQNNYELTVKVSTEAVQGWNLYKKGIFTSKNNGGRYTDPDKSTRVYDFWSNGEYAKYDRDNNGHHETIFLIKEKELIYVGSIGSKGTFIDVSNTYKKFLHKPLIKLIKQY